MASLPPIIQNPDIRVLGRILGDVIRTRGGDELFRRTEAIRTASVQRHRGSAHVEAVTAELGALSLDDTLSFTRGFMLFSMLANLAEDIHRERRRAIHVRAGDPPQDSSLAATYRKLAGASIDGDLAAERLAGASVVPVITAHPTETRRRSVFEITRRVLDLMRRRDALRTGPQDRVTEAELAEVVVAREALRVAVPELGADRVHLVTARDSYSGVIVAAGCRASSQPQAA